MTAADPVAALDAAIAALATVRAMLAEPKPEPGPVYVDQETCAPLSKRSFLEHARAGAFPTSKVGRRVLCARADFDTWLTSKRRVIAPPATAEADPTTAAIDLAVERFRRRGARAA
jgi:hypothetical protein